MIPTVTPSILRVRRFVFVLANVVIFAILIATLGYALGNSALGWVMIACFAMFAPWSVLGVTTALIGFVLLFKRRPVPEPPVPIELRTAIVMTLRNEDPSRALQRLRIVQDSLDATGEAAHFAFFVLSDTSDPATASREEAEIAAWRLVDPRPGRIFYRRRTDNTGFKAGNLMEFCETLGADYDLIVPLDADSLMSGGAILDLVRIMQGDSQLGIVQGLVVGLPAASAFARMFQFGMRHGMRTYTVGQAWWTHDCGPFWGHNAILRIAPFRAHCRLPLLPGAPPFGGHIMSHDQVEAVLMRRAGYSVRLQAIAGGSWEDNPPTILDYINQPAVSSAAGNAGPACGQPVSAALGGAHVCRHPRAHAANRPSTADCLGDAWLKLIAGNRAEARLLGFHADVPRSEAGGLPAHRLESAPACAVRQPRPRGPRRPCRNRVLVFAKQHHLVSHGMFHGGAGIGALDAVERPEP
jgi:membrane glycosyltransferase